MFDAVFHKLLHKFESILNHQTQIFLKLGFFKFVFKTVHSLSVKQQVLLLKANYRYEYCDH